MGKDNGIGTDTHTYGLGWGRNPDNYEYEPKGIKAAAGSIHTKATNAPAIMAGSLRKIVLEAGIARSMNRLRKRNS